MTNAHVYYSGAVRTENKVNIMKTFRKKTLSPEFDHQEIAAVIVKRKRKFVERYARSDSIVYIYARSMSSLTVSVR